MTDWDHLVDGDQLVDGDLQVIQQFGFAIFREHNLSCDLNLNRVQTLP